MTYICEDCGTELEHNQDEYWRCPKCDQIYTVKKPLTLDQWVDQFPQIKHSSRALWRAIRWEFEEQGYPMTVRQMFYRMSSNGIVPKTEGGYRQVQYALTAMRRADAIPYSWLADNTRWRSKPNTWNGISDALINMQQYYRRELWSNQRYHVEIWLEKDALRGVVSTITDEYDVGLYVTRGYPSLSYLHEAAESLKSINKPIVIYHFGDFDASGQDAARSIREGLEGFGARFRFEQVAVTEWQIDFLKLQTRPSKKSDPRAARHGSVSVELDAIPPAKLRDMVRSSIEGLLDQSALEMMRKIESEEKARIKELARDFGSSTKIA